MFLTAVVVLGTSVPLASQIRGKGYAPVVVEAPSGQQTVPELKTYIEMQIYTHLKPNDNWWLAGEPIRKSLT